MKKILALASVCVVIGGFSAKAEEPLRAEKPVAERDFQWRVLFEKEAAVIRVDADVPVGFIKSTIEALQDAGHTKFALKQAAANGQAPARDTLWMQIRVKNGVAELDVPRDLPAKTVVEVINQLQETSIEKFRFAAPRK